MANEGYVHGRGNLEGERLRDQAETLVDLLHAGTRYEAGARVLEVGCGVGAQTLPLAQRSPGARFTAFEISERSIGAAMRAVAAADLDNVRFVGGDLRALPFAEGAFDHAFVCFVLEHLSRPAEALAHVSRLLVPGGTVTVIEGDHGSAFFHPDSSAARAAVACQVELQRRAGGDALLGRRLYPLMVEAGLAHVHVSARTVYADATRPGLVDGFIRRTFTPMIAGVREGALSSGLARADAFDRGIHDLLRTSEADGTFHYSFFKGTGTRAPAQ